MTDKENDKRTECVLNRSCGGFPYELHLDIRVNGKNLWDAIDSVTEYIKDHAEEICIPMYPYLMKYPNN